MSPVEVLERMVSMVGLLDRYRRPGRPGEMLEHLSVGQREALRELRSDDIAKDSVGSYYGMHMPYDNARDRVERFREELMRFDLEVLRIDPRTLRQKRY